MLYCIKMLRSLCICMRGRKCSLMLYCQMITRPPTDIRERHMKKVIAFYVMPYGNNNAKWALLNNSIKVCRRMMRTFKVFLCHSIIWSCAINFLGLFAAPKSICLASNALCKFENKTPLPGIFRLLSETLSIIKYF